MYSIVSYQKQAIEPVGESLSDYEVVGEVAKRFNLYKEFTNDRTVGEMIEDGFYGSGCDEYVSFEDWKKKGYAIIPTHPDWDKVPPGLRVFHDDPDNNRLLTPSGKIEFFSQNLAKYFPDDEERPPVPHWIESGVSHDERISSVRAEKYPLLVVSNHPHWRVHANCDDITWCREAKTAKVRGFDGYQYEPLWLNPADAAARGIKDGDIVRIYNERGAVLAGAYVVERVMEGSISMDHGARYDPIVPGEFDRGGAINTITPHNKTSKNATGMVCSSFLVEVEKVTPKQMDEWKAQYPDAFDRTYRPCPGRVSCRLAGRGGTLNESFPYRRRYLQRLLQLPDRLQGRALLERLDAYRGAPAGDGSVLDEGGRIHTRQCPQGQDALRPGALPALR